MRQHADTAIAVTLPRRESSRRIGLQHGQLPAERLALSQQRSQIRSRSGRIVHQPDQFRQPFPHPPCRLDTHEHILPQGYDIHKLFSIIFMESR